MATSAENLPAKELNWEFDCRRALNLTTGDWETALRYIWSDWTYQITGTVHKCWGGTFATGTTGNVRFTPTEFKNSPKNAGIDSLPLGDVLPLVGKTVDFIGALSAGNNGTFTIVAVDPSGLWFEFNNGGTPVFQSDSTVFARIDNGKFTTPLTVKGSSAGSTGKGSGMDGKDRWVSISDMQSSTAVGGSKSWIVIQTAGGAEWLINFYTNANTRDWIRLEIWASPESGFTGGTTTTRPTAADERLERNNTVDWYGDAAPQSDVHYHTFMIDDTGKNFIWFATGNNYVHTTFMTFQAKDFVDGPAIPWSGNRNVMDMSYVVGGSVFTISIFNDSPQFVGTFDKDAVAGGPYFPSFYLSAAFLTTATLPQHIDPFTDELTETEFNVWPVGLASLTAQVQGRHGRIPDLFYINENVDRGMHQGSFMPKDNSKQWVNVGHILIPWDGVTEWRDN